MITIYLYHPTAAFRGFLSRYLAEIYPNCFSGDIPAGTVQEIETLCTKYCEGAIFQRSTNTEQGWFLSSCGSTPYAIDDFDGVQLLSTPEIRLPIWKKLWAKSSPYISLVQHMDEVGGMMKYLMTESAYANLGALMAHLMGLPLEDAANTLAIFAALHDLGKAHPAFQIKGKANLRVYNFVLHDLYRDGYIHDAYQIEGFRHEIYSAELLKLWCQENGFGDNEVECIIKPIRNHHIRENATNDTEINIEDHPGAWHDMQKKIIEHIQNEFPPQIFHLRYVDKTKFTISYYSLLLLCDQTCSKCL